MAVSRAKKIEQVEELSQELKKAKKAFDDKGYTD